MPGAGTTIPRPRPSPGAAFVVRYGVTTTIVLFTVSTVLLSVITTQLLFWPLRPISDRLSWAGLLISIIAPVGMAPPTIWLLGGLLLRIEAARRQAEQLATTDALTGVMNRRHFFALGEPEVARALGSRTGLGVLLLDIDRFKSVNDGHGHAAGDAVLKAVAACCALQLRAYDMLARLGGEEFAILLGEVDESQALQAAERVRLAVQALAVDIGGGTVVRPTVSIGVSLARSDGDRLDGLLVAADRGMYAAKHGGRNRVCRAPPLDPGPAPAHAVSPGGLPRFGPSVS